MYYAETEKGRFGPFEFMTTAILYAMIVKECDECTIVQSQSCTSHRQEPDRP